MEDTLEEEVKDYSDLKPYQIGEEVINICLCYSKDHK